jgi:hypothetical protein
MAAFLLGSGEFSARAVLFYSTGDTAYNTSASGTIAETAWDYEGRWGGYLGTAIAPHFFITAKHVKGTTAYRFYYRGGTYTPLVAYDAPGGVDLTIWQVAEPLPAWAPLYLKTDEVGKSLVVIGRGTQRGAEVKVGTDLKGWQQGSADHVQRWGENVVSGINTVNSSECLAAEFNAGAGANEAHLTVGDSGGAVFLQDSDLTWKLAGINYAVDGKWSYSGGSDTGFNAAIFDEGGLYLGNQNKWTYITDQSTDIPSHFYSTRISSYQDWILSVIPEPRDYALATAGLLGLMALWRRRGRS